MEPERGFGAERGSATRYLWVLLLGALLFTVLRIPSFLEPHWYTDEAGYATTARGLLQGKTLYAQMWTNKPPLGPWTVAIALQLVGPAEWALHTLTYLSGLLALAALAYAGNRLLPPARSVMAVVVAAVLLGAPLLGSELSIPENLLIAPAAWAGALLLTHLGGEGRWWPVAVGALAAMAIAYQQTAVADAAAFAVIVLFGAARPRRSFVTYLATVCLGTALWLVPSFVLGGPSRAAFALIGFYIPFTGSVLPHHGGPLREALLLVVATGAAILGAYLLRRRPVVIWGSWFWAIATALVAGAAHQPYGHYLIPTIVPGALALAAVPFPSLRAFHARQAAGLAALVVAVGTTVALATVIRYDWMLYQFWVSPYYGGFVGVVAGRESLTTWQQSFDARVASDEAVTAWVQAHHLEGTRTVVWSSDAWLYLTADLPLLLPTAPIYNDEVVIGHQGPVAQQVARLQPQMIVTSSYDTEKFPEIDPLLKRHYHEVYSSGVNSVWMRDGTAVSRGP